MTVKATIREHPLLAIVSCLACAAFIYFAVLGVVALASDPGPRHDLVAATLVDGRPAVVVGVCENEPVKSVFINDSTSADGEGPTLWRLNATGTSDVDTFVIGDTPEGFVQTVELETPLPQRELSVWAITGGTDGTKSIEQLDTIDFSKVTSEALYVDGRPSTREEFFRGNPCVATGHRYQT